MVVGSMLLFVLGGALFGMAHLPEWHASSFVGRHGLDPVACPVDAEHTRMVHTSLGSFLVHLN